MNNEVGGASYRRSNTDFKEGDVLGRSLYEREYRQGLNRLASKDEMEMELASLSKLLDILDKIKTKNAEHKNLMNDIKGIQDDIIRALAKEGVNEKEILSLNKEINNLKIKALKEQSKYQSVNNRKEINDLKLRNKLVEELIKKEEKLSKITKYDNFTKGLKEFSKDLMNISQTLNIEKLVSGGTDSLRKIRRDTMSSLGLSSSQFNEFKNELLTSVEAMNSNIGSSLYGLNDVVDYISNLNNLGVYSTTLAKQQVEAAIVGNKLLGMSVETQATIIKTMKRSGNTEMLQKQNETVAALLKSNLDISKEQLAMLSTNTANFTDMMSYSGLTGEALDRLQTSMTVGQAAVTSAFNADTNNAVYTLLSDIMMNPNSSNLYKVGSQTEAIRGSLMAGDYGSALQALLKSDYYKELANRDINSQTWMNLSAEDKMIANMVRNQNKLDMSEYNKVMGMSSSEAKKYLDEMQKAQADSLTWQEKISNWFSLKFGKLDWVVFTSLGTIAFGLYITSKVFELVPKAFKFLFGTGGVLRGAGSITNSVGAIKAFASGTASFASAALPVITTIGVAIAGLAAAFLAYKSFAKDWKDAEANGSSGIAGAIFGTRKGLENVISNGFKFLLVGIVAAAAAILAGAPLAVAAGIVAGLAALGALLGAIGNLLGIGKKKADVGGVDNVGGTALAGVGGVSSPVVGGKAAIKPWGISSRFGPRSYKYKGKMVHDNHKGIDLTSKSGTPLGANAAGYVVAKGSGWSGGRGNYVAIEDAKGWRHTYMHMIQPTNLKKGDYVNEAQIVGYMGSTGRSTGTHLHYQINQGSKAIDPEPYLTSNLVRASAFGKTNKSLLPSVSNKKDAEEKDNILSKFISEDTRQKDLVASQYANYFATETGVGGPESSGITGTVKTGFGDLLNKLDELSAKQEDQERVLSALTGRMGTSLFKY